MLRSDIACSCWCSMLTAVYSQVQAAALQLACAVADVVPAPAVLFQQAIQVLSIQQRLSRDHADAQPTMPLLQADHWTAKHFALEAVLQYMRTEQDEDVGRLVPPSMQPGDHVAKQ